MPSLMTGRWILARLEAEGKRPELPVIRRAASMAMLRSLVIVLFGLAAVESGASAETLSAVANVAKNGTNVLSASVAAKTGCPGLEIQTTRAAPSLAPWRPWLGLQLPVLILTAPPMVMWLSGPLARWAWTGVLHVPMHHGLGSRGDFGSSDARSTAPPRTW